MKLINPRLIFLLAMVLPIEACSLEVSDCRSTIESSHAFIMSSDFSVDALNNIGERQELVSTLKRYDIQLSNCSMDISTADEVDILSVFTVYKSDMSSLIKIMDVGDNKISYSSTISSVVADMKSVPIGQLLEKSYKHGSYKPVGPDPYK